MTVATLQALDVYVNDLPGVAARQCHNLLMQVQHPTEPCK